jgi:glycosyltransferase involved in cell wall biosynthesis/SAM-dependent methyltransferase
VASVLAQTDPDWQLVIVDDGSRDGTAEWVRGIGDRRVELVSVAHCGNPARLRNLGIARARGDWIAFLDSDDLWMPRKLEAQRRALAAHPECRWSYTAALLIDEAGAELPLERFEPWTPRSGQIVRELLVHAASIPCPSVLARRDLLESAGAFDESLPFCEDYDLWLRLATASPVWAVPEPLCKIRLHPGNNTRDRPEVNRSFIEVYERFARRAGAEPAWRALCDRQRAFYWVHLSKQLWRRGERVQGATAFARAFRLDPSHPAWWSALESKLFPSSPSSPGGEPVAAPSSGAAIAAAYDTLAPSYDRHLERDRWMRQVLWRHFDRLFASGARVLDAGCGTGIDTLHLASRGVRVTAVDLSPGMLGQLRAKLAGARGTPVDVRLGDLVEIAGELEGPFDGIVSSFAALNTVDLAAFARAAARLLRPGGRLVLHFLASIGQRRSETGRSDAALIEVGGESLWHHRLAPEQIYDRYFAPGFRWRGGYALGFFVSRKLETRLPSAVLDVLGRVEATAGAAPPFLRRGRFFVLDLER